PESHRVLPREPHRVRRSWSYRRRDVADLQVAHRERQLHLLPSETEPRQHDLAEHRLDRPRFQRSALIDEVPVRIAKLFGRSNAAVLASTCCAFKSKSFRGESG